MSIGAALQSPNHRFVFIGGLHRSGTSVLHRCLRAHPSISGFSGTGVPEDEGQHLQTVYPPAKKFGGPGMFGFDRRAHLDESSDLVSDKTREILLAEWSRYWDAHKPVLVEKSPPNLIWTRFLQAMFRPTYFIILVRHPVAVACATQKWSWTTLHSLLRHWVVCHELFMQDRDHLANVFVLHYESFVLDPGAYLDRIYSFVGVEPLPCTEEVRSDVNRRYFERWRRAQRRTWTRWYYRRVVAGLEPRVNRFGYSLIDLQRSGEAEYVRAV